MSLNISNLTCVVSDAALKTRLGPLLSMLVKQARSLHPIQVMFTWLRAVVREGDVDVVAVVEEAAQVEA